VNLAAGICVMHRLKMHTFSSPYSFMAPCLIKRKDNCASANPSFDRIGTTYLSECPSTRSGFKRVLCGYKSYSVTNTLNCQGYMSDRGGINWFVPLHTFSFRIPPDSTLPTQQNQMFGKISLFNTHQTVFICCITTEVTSGDCHMNTNAATGLAASIFRVDQLPWRWKLQARHKVVIHTSLQTNQLTN
jgi:hypothetical protein